MTDCLRQSGLPQSIVADFSTGLGISVTVRMRRRHPERRPAVSESPRRLARLRRGPSRHPRNRVLRNGIIREVQRAWDPVTALRGSFDGECLQKPAVTFNLGHRSRLANSADAVMIYGMFFGKEQDKNNDLT